MTHYDVVYHISEFLWGTDLELSSRDRNRDMIIPDRNCTRTPLPSSTFPQSIDAALWRYIRKYIISIINNNIAIIIIWFILDLISPSNMVGSSLTTLLSLHLQAFLSEVCVSVSPSARQPMPITSVQVFLGRPRQRPPVGLGFWTALSQPSPYSTWPCHMSQQERSAFVRSSSCSPWDLVSWLGPCWWHGTSSRS